MLKKLSRLIRTALCLTLALSLFNITAYPYEKKTLYEKYGAGYTLTAEEMGYTQSLTANYRETLLAYESMGYKNYTGSDIVLSPENAVITGGATIEDNAEYGAPVIVFGENTDKIEWTVNIAEEGLYTISADGFADISEANIIQRGIMVNGEYPFTEAENIAFERVWEEASGVILNRATGDEKSPKLKQRVSWRRTDFMDALGFYDTPLLFYFKKGENTVTLTYVSSTLTLGNVYISAPKQIPAYSDVYGELVAGGAKEYSGEPIRFEAEEAVYRSEQFLRRVYDSDPATYPNPDGYVRQNAIGGYSWKEGNQKITWQLEAPEDGFYKVAFRALQNFSGGITTHRQIKIDDEVIYGEFSSYPFYFSREWEVVTLSDGEGTPLLVYLTKGIHTLSFEVKLGGLGEVVSLLGEVNQELSSIIRDITKITSSSPDLDFDYEIDKKAPSIIEKMKNARDKLTVCAELLDSQTVKRTQMSNRMYSLIDDFDLWITKPERIPAKLKEMSDSQSNLSSWYIATQEQPLIIDYIELLSPTDKPDAPKSGFFQKLRISFLNFFRSFFKDYNAIDSALADEDFDETTVLDVWVARGKEWGELIQTMSDDDFTEKTGIVVKINILPSGSAGAIGVSPLMLSLVSGNEPDVALGSDSVTPVELAIRDKACDLSQFSDFNEVRERFWNGMLTPFEFKDGVYALPETFDFKFIIYRKDILADLGIPIPDTWKELYTRTLPSLKQNGLEFYMGSNYDMFLFQNGGSYYDETGKNTALNSEAAYTAFSQWVNNYNIYQMARSADIFNHFKVGDMPLVVGDINDYLKLDFAAPELYGRWGIEVLPGIEDDNGDVARYSGGGVASAMIFDSTDKKEQSWEFLKWWTSADVQNRFNQELISVMGRQGRWITANVEAFQKLGWKTEDLKVMNEQLEWFMTMPNVLGGYYTGRSVNNAWTRVVMQSMNVRDSFEQAIKEITRELDRKNEEYETVYKND